MKKLLPLFCIALLAGLAACNDDSEDPVPPQPPKPTARICAITLVDLDKGPRTLPVEYDPQGRPAAIGDNRFSHTPDTLRAWLKPAADAYGYDYDYLLSDGAVERMTGVQLYGPDSKFPFDCSYLYRDGRLEGFDFAEPYERSMRFVWEGDAISSAIRMTNSHEFRFSYGSVRNNMNLDLFGLIYGILVDEPDYAWMLGYTGQRCALLPDKIVSLDLGEATLQYTVDEGGYITRIDIRQVPDAHEPFSTYVSFAYGQPEQEDAGQ